MKKRILCVILSLVAVFSLVGFNATEAWFSDGNNKGMEIHAGNLNFTASELSLKTTDENGENIKFLPDSTIELEKPVYITNESTIDTELRIKIECSYVDKNNQTVEGLPWALVESADDANSWKIVEEEGISYIYYRPDGNSRIPAVKAAETTTKAPSDEEAVDEGEVTESETTVVTTAVPTGENVIVFDGSLKINGKVPFELNGKDMTISLVIQAKQADFMEWKNFYNPAGMPVAETTTTTTTAEADDTPAQ